MLRILISISLVLCSTTAWVNTHCVSKSYVPTTQLQATTPSRSQFLQHVAWTGFASTTALIMPTYDSIATAAESVTLPNGLTYIVIKSGNGPKPDVGELVAIRFAAYNGDIKIDDVFETPEPYYTRLGSGGLIPGVEQILPMMRLGDRWKLTIPVGGIFYRFTLYHDLF